MCNRADAGNYSVIVTNPAGSVTSSNAVLTVLTLPQITNQPAGQSNSVGATVTFSVGAVGQVPLKYHWQFNGTNRGKRNQTGGAVSAAPPTNPRHQQRADEQQRQLLGHRHEHGRVGDQFAMPFCWT